MSEAMTIDGMICAATLGQHVNVRAFTDAMMKCDDEGEIDVLVGVACTILRELAAIEAAHAPEAVADRIAIARIIDPASWNGHDQKLQWASRASFEIEAEKLKREAAYSVIGSLDKADAILALIGRAS